MKFFNNSTILKNCSEIGLYEHTAFVLFLGKPTCKIRTCLYISLYISIGSVYEIRDFKGIGRYEASDSDKEYLFGRDCFSPAPSFAIHRNSYNIMTLGMGSHLSRYFPVEIHYVAQMYPFLETFGFHFRLK
jgi:hypothetical protein